MRVDWSLEEVAEVFHSPLLELVHRAANVHRTFHDPRQVQKCTLLSIKTGGCQEDCGYCSQSARRSKETGVKATPLMQEEPVLEAALAAKAAGSTRFCMGTAWRGPEQVGPRQFKRILTMVEKIRGMGLEVCTTLGMLNADQAKQLREAAQRKVEGERSEGVANTNPEMCAADRERLRDDRHDPNGCGRHQPLLACQPH